MRALITLLLTVLCSTHAFAGRRHRAPIADSVLVAQLQAIDTELADNSHEERAVKSAYRVLLYAGLVANKGRYPISITSTPDDSDVADVLEAIENGLNNISHSYIQSRILQYKLQFVLKLLEKKRVEEEIPTANVSFDVVGEFNFGTILIFDTAFNTFVLTNSGTTDVTLTEVGTLSGDPFRRSLFSDCIVGSVLQPGQSCEAEVQFAPEATETFAETLTIRFNDGQTDGEASVDIVGSAMPRN